MPQGRPKEPTGEITDAADYLYAIIQEFKGLDEAATVAMREGRVLLDVAVDRMFKAYERNAIVARRKAEVKAMKSR